MFGEDWPANRVFPNTAIADGESVTFDDVKFTVIDLGPSESPHDSPWMLGDDDEDGLPRRPDLRPQALLPRRRLLRGMASEHRDAPQRASPRAPSSTSVTAVRSESRCGTGSASYIERFVEAVSGADWSNPDQAKAAVVGRMKAYEPTRRAADPDGAEHRADRNQARAAGASGLSRLRLRPLSRLTVRFRRELRRSVRDEGWQGVRRLCGAPAPSGWLGRMRSR